MLSDGYGASFGIGGRAAGKNRRGVQTTINLVWGIDRSVTTCYNGGRLNAVKKGRLEMIRNEKGIVLAVVLQLITTLALMGSAAVFLTRINLKSTSNYKNYTKSFYVADAATQYAKGALAFTDLNPITWSSSSFLEAESTIITVTPNSGDPNAAVISATSTLRGSNVTIELGVIQAEPTMVGVVGGITSNGPVAVNGTLDIDGRDHDLNCNVISGAGVPGIYSNSTFEQGGNSGVGGFVDGVGYPLANPGDPAVVITNGTEAVATPDEAVGFSEGTLKYAAQIGINGGQYVTDPNDLVLPLQGVTYVELSSGSTWQSSNMLTDGTGILVVHNLDTNAILENTNGGRFTGLVIADDIIHLHNEVVGAVVTLTPNPSAGNVLGNGTGSVCYSSIALNGLNFITEINEISWREMFN